MIFKVILVCATLIKFTLEECGVGCLKCTANNRCIFCDPTNNYYLKEGTCSVSNVKNCLMLDSNGECAQCESNFYLDFSTKKCVQIEKTKLIDNCKTYKDAQTCGKCSPNFYVENGKCVAVTQPVNNCESYLQNGKCASCTSGFMFTAERDNCTPSPNLYACYAYTFMSCKSCASGYVPNQNLYFYNYYISSGLIRTDIEKNSLGKSSDWLPLNYCQKQKDPNCLTATLYNYCTECKKGYYLTAQKTCRLNPLPPIENCSIHASITECSVCKNNYYLELPTKCTLIEGYKTITDCISYNSSSTTIQCTQCIKTKYLFGNLCTFKRTSSLNITHCKILEAAADTCSECESNFILTNDKLKCLPNIDHCKEYDDSLFITTALTCKICEDKYYLQKDDGMTKCLSGELEGCITYQSRFICSACDTSAYYLKNNTCFKHVNVPHCVNYSETEFNQCVTCEAGYYPFALIQTCSQISVITNCTFYRDPLTCSACADGYFLHSNKCVLIESVFPNCLSIKSDGTGCLSCAPGYGLKSLTNDRTCVQNHNYIIDNCDKYGSDIYLKANDEMDYDSCTACKENSYPFDLSCLYVCISNDLLSTRGLSTLVPGCVQYNNDAAPLCMQCSGFLVIQSISSRSCVNSCDKTTNTFVADNLDGTINTCHPNTSNSFRSVIGCSSAIKIYTSSLILKCMKFVSNQPIVLLNAVVADNASFFRDIDDSTVPKVDGAFLYYGFEIFQSANTDTNAHDQQGDINKACELYWKTGTTLYCYRCKWGYSSKHFTPFGGSLKTQCVLIDNCDTTVSYSGFSSQLNQVLSCHVCTGGKALTLILGTLLDNGTLNIQGLVREKIVLQCLTPNTVNGAVASETSPVAVNGCLIYGWIFVISNPASPTNPVTSKGCIACKPGFKLSAYFGTCTAIVNCDTSKNLMANRCSACTQSDANGNTEYKAFSSYSADTCLKVKTDNCLIANTVPDTDSKYECRICKTGYWLNYDYKCEAIIIPQCSDGLGLTNVTPLPIFNSLQLTVEYYILKKFSKTNTIAGCVSCSTGFTAMQLTSGETQCIKSPYVQASSYVIALNNYIPDCLKYDAFLNIGAHPKVKCVYCKENKILTSDSKKCVASIANCKIANNIDTTKCDICQSTHVKVSNVCVLKNIEHCQSYDESPGITDLVCKICDDGYVLSSNQKICYAGYVVGCKSYNTDLPWICNSCLQGYNKVNTFGPKTYCIKANNDTNCVSLETESSIGLQGGLFRCTTCTINNTVAFLPKDYPRSDKTIFQSICTGLNLVDNCVEYDVKKRSVEANNLLCSLCSPHYYLNTVTYSCVKRTINPVGCVEFYIDKDKCKTCRSSTFKNSDETDCINSPTGIPRCDTYLNDAVCKSCKAPAYLYKNECPLSTIISNCSAYSANYTCTSCEKGYYLFNTTSCIKAIAQNCYTYISIDACEKCDPYNSNKGLKKDDSGVINCVDKNLSNCASSTDEYPFICIQCITGFFLDNEGNCKPAKTINKCLVYESETTCKICEQGSALSVDHKSCNDTYYSNYIDKNCADSQILSSPVCIRCNPGYFFVNNNCTPCALNEYNSGCYSCNPVYESTCLSCKPGYYQTSKGNCVLPPAVTDTDMNADFKSHCVLVGLGNLTAILILLVALFE